jgi:hypothetical protein
MQNLAPTPLVCALFSLAPAAARAVPSERAADSPLVDAAQEEPAGNAPPIRDQKPRSGPCEDDGDDRELCQLRDIYFMPALQATFFAPSAMDERPFVGAGVALVPVRWSHNNDRFGPSQGAMFLQASLLRSTASDSTLALFDVGYTLSFERNSSRRWLIPYFGGTLGRMTHADLPDSTYTYQFLGVHLFWHENLVVSAEGGYQFPFSNVDEVRGPRAQLSAGFSMW